MIKIMQFCNYVIMQIMQIMRIMQILAPRQSYRKLVIIYTSINELLEKFEFIIEIISREFYDVGSGVWKSHIVQ